VIQRSTVESAASAGDHVVDAGDHDARRLGRLRRSAGMPAGVDERDEPLDGTRARGQRLRQIGRAHV
jgi:hypothetical protein